MKRFLFVLGSCSSLVLALALFLFPVTQAAENPLLTLLNLPAPPPPNPQVTLPWSEKSEKFYSKSNPPPDSAPIEDLIEYWRVQSENYVELGYNPKPSEKVVDRLLAEVEKDPSKANLFLNAFRESNRAADVIKKIYDRDLPANDQNRDARARLRGWLTFNSPHFSSELERGASRVADVSEYVSHQTELLALGRVDWNRARPIVDRLYAGNQRVSRVLAQWALYRRALDENSLSDIDRYRDELKAVVEDKTATDGMRDLAFDALIKEKEWDGRDDWYYTLLADETLDDLRVNGSTYTGLTTIMYYSPDEKYIDRMAELVRSDNKVVRTAAAKNLLKRLGTRNPDVIRALLPWLEDPKWLNAEPNGRTQLVAALSVVKMPESVPALIAALDEKDQRVPYSYYAANAMNAAAHAANSAANMSFSIANRSVAAAIANGAINVSKPLPTETYYPLRYAAIGALGYQAEGRAVPALRRVFNESEQSHEQGAIVRAIYLCGGFTIPEQVAAVEEVARMAGDEPMSSYPMSNAAATAANTMTNAAIAAAYAASYGTRMSGFNRTGNPATDVRRMLGATLVSTPDVGDDLARAVVDRIGSHDRSDPDLAAALRRIVMGWQSGAVNAMLLRDLKNGRTDVESLMRLLVLRRELREKQQADVSDLRTGSPTAVGISACLLEDPNDYEAMLNNPSAETKTALLACARLIRAPLPVKRVAENLASKDSLLALAAERYLESEDSPEARKIVLSLHPKEAKILGASSVFRGAGDGPMQSIPRYLIPLFATVNDFYRLSTNEYEMFHVSDGALPEIEKRLQDEIKKDPKLLGVYYWGTNFIHVYKDRAVLSWQTDPARYHERVLTAEEFDNFKGLIAHYDADRLPPFLSCPSCESRELLMLGPNGGRRVYVKASALPPLFAELDRTFEGLRQAPSVIKYWAGKDVPGLEVLFASDGHDAMAVWKSGADFRLLVSDKARRDEIASELESYNEPLDENMTEEEEYESVVAEAVEKERARREYESYAWFDFSAGGLGSQTSQPADLHYIPVQDSLGVIPEEDQWKVRSGTTEIRADDKGLYKVVAGKLTKIKTGRYSNPVITPNGRWAIAAKVDQDEDSGLVRVNLQTNKEFKVAAGELPAYRAIAFVPSVNRVIVGPYDEYFGYHSPDKEGDDDSSRYAWLDPETGTVAPVRGEVRPLVHQSYRPLQPTGKPFEFWAAIPKEDDTIVGLYDSRTFKLTPVVRLSKIAFDSMDLWADEAGGKLYFVYEGHLLAIPVKVR